MSGGGGDAPPLTGGEFILQLLKNPPHQPPIFPAPPSLPQTLPHDPAVAVVGPTLPFPSSSFPSNGHDLPFRPPPPPWPHHSHTPPFAPHEYFNPQNPIPKPSLSSTPPGFNYNQALLDEVRHGGFYSSNNKVNFGALTSDVNFGSFTPNVNFGSFPAKIGRNQGVLKETLDFNLAPRAKVEGFSTNESHMGLESRILNGLEVEFNRIPQVNPMAFGNSVQERAGSSSTGGNYRSMEATSQVRRPPPGFSSKATSVGNKGFKQNVDKGKGYSGQTSYRNNSFGSNDDYERERMRFDDVFAERRVSGQFENPGVPRGSNLHSVSASDIEESLMELHGTDGEDEKKYRDNVLDERELEDLDEQLVDSLVLEDGLDEKDDKKQQRKSRDKDYRSDKRGQWILNQRMRNYKRQIECRNDINRLNAPFLAIYESLIPSEEEKAKQKQLLALLDNHVTKEWPGARLYLYGSCANSFGFTKSDIDVCLAIEDADVNKAEVLLKLADILQSDNLENVQALTRARVPIVKLKDPATGISCDICVNNLLAVINTKLLRDYAKIDERLRQLAFIIKHWAKSRGVNETYQGTLSSYAYVLMCIHFLQQRRPSILPCLQGMERTYAVTVDNVECAFFDQVEKLRGFGSRNGESIAQLVWAFFNYWAHCHDYANDVISVRTGSLLSKRLKDWTRRIGNDRHLICIEDPFEVTHDLGRVVDKRSIRVLREEFERAAEVMQYDPDPCVTLFQPYVPS